MIRRSLAGQQREGGGQTEEGADAQRLRTQAEEMGRYLLERGPWQSEHQMPHHYLPVSTITLIMAVNCLPLLELIVRYCLQGPVARRRYCARATQH